MEHFVKKFTIIDFLSMFIPGGILILAWNYYVGGVLEPFYQFFGKQDIILAGYFIAISYLTGMVLQEISKPLENNWGYILDELNEKWQNDSKIKNNYMNHLATSLEDVQQTDGKSVVGRKIYLYVADNPIAGSKLELFHAFYIMARISFVVFIGICILSILCGSGSTSACTNKLIVPVVSAIAAYLMYHRSKRFYKLTYERAYRDFLKLSNS